MYRGPRPEAIDTRWVFRTYAILAAAGGFCLLSWGPMAFGVHLPGLPWGKAALIRMAGAILMAAGCCAAAFSTVENDFTRRRQLFWFAGAHTLVGAVLLVQRFAIWGPGLAGAAAHLVLVLATVLFYVWATADGEFGATGLTSLFTAGEPGNGEQLRSRYERQIREMARQEERHRLARDLHDSVKQQLFVIQTAAATAQTRFDGDPGGARESLEHVRTAAREAAAEMQAMLDQLRAAPIENTGLVESLRKQCEALGFRTGAQVDCRIGELPPSPALAPGTHEALLRVAQEALSNIGRHARASHVSVSLAALRDNLELRIEDNGSGFDANRPGSGQGIANMRARAEEAGGRFELVSRPGEGSSMTLSIPFAGIEPPAAYARRGALWAVALAATGALHIWTDSLGNSLWTAIAALGLLRYLAAYRRALRHWQGAR